MWYDYTNRNTNVLASVLGNNHQLPVRFKLSTSWFFYGSIVYFRRDVVKGPLDCNTSYSFALKNPFKNAMTGFALLIQVLVKRP